MEKQPLVSILVPIYNVEEYLTECLTSIINQTLKNIEIICINDGSTDNSLNIIKSFMKNDSRIKLINKSNSGYGDSMNQGLSQTYGKYVGIVESDDIADLKMFEELYSLAIKNSFPDIIKSNYFSYWSTDKKRYYEESLPRKLTNKVFKPLNLIDIFKAGPSIWSAIYKNNFLKNHNILFNTTPGASYQDTSFNFKTLYYCETMFCTRKAFLNYRQDNINSSVNNKEKIYCICDEYKVIENCIKPNDKIKPLLLYIKFKSYIWNFNRLTESFQDIFLDIFIKEFIKEKSSIDFNLFEKENKILLSSILSSDKKLFKKELNIQRNIHINTYLSYFTDEIEKEDNSNLIIYGFNNIAKDLIEKFHNKVIIIIDRKNNLNSYKDIPIINFEHLNIYTNEIFVITTINNIFIKEIKENILKKFPFAKIIEQN